MTIDKLYDPQQIEKTLYAKWEENKYFAPQGHGKPFCILYPPPNVTGSLHMGHGFGTTLMDILIRYHRMMGDQTLWQTGTDHAGIATQMVVERQLNAAGKTRHDVGRDAFLEKIWQWKNESGGKITQQLRRLGASQDWSRERFTMDDDLSYAVREVFIKLYEEELIYRGKRLVNWDPVLHTAISDLEVVNEEETGSMWFIRYPLANSTENLIVATTRPETLLGDVAVAVHPDDKRYKHLIGKDVLLPLTNRKIPIIADEYVDPLFGTGCVKITPAHDFNDYAVGMRHGLEPINIFTHDAHLNQNAPEKYQGLERFDARKTIVTDLDLASLIEKIEPHILKVPRGDRTGAIIEPYLTHQWYVKSKELAKPAIKAVEKGEITFIPDNWNKTYFQWMYNIEDWCISRQLWWGHRIPVWYDNEGNAYVGHDENEVRKKHALSDEIVLRQDEDVLDTWFSSALWPFATLGWPNHTAELTTFLPTNVLVTGFDIIFFWVARMIMMTLKFTGKIPFKQVYITGLIRDAEGQKMSKSKGNVLDPIDLIDGISLFELVGKRTSGLMQPKMMEKIKKNTEKEFPEGIPNYGTDALRFTFCGMASYSRDIRFDMNRLAANRNFCNKLWNASRYVLMNTEEKDTGLTNHDVSLSLADRWILAKLQEMIVKVHAAIHEYRFDQLAQALYEFTWNEFCDWYLELSKPLLYNPESTEAALRGTRQTLVRVLETLLRLLHPVLPFITEAIWQRVAPLTGKNGKTIMLEAYPTENAALLDKEALAELEWVKSVIVSVRTIRSEMNVSPSKKITTLFWKGNDIHAARFKTHGALLATLAKVESTSQLSANDAAPPSASAFVGELEIFIPLADLINKEEEIARLTREINKLDKELVGLNNKLGNPGFVEKAPQDVVQKEREKQAELDETKAKLTKQLMALM